jgi:nitrite reductase/ring-hydroxylating ferredoxin subunit/uncharacterized membrane protein
VRQLLGKLERAAGLDRFGDRLQRGVQAALPQPVRDVLHGVPLGHPLHPALVAVPIGAWAGAAVLDLMPDQRRAATAMVALGTAGAVPSAAAGLNDWADLTRDQRRVGLVHALANSVGLGLYAGSLAARLAGRHRLGRTLGFLALGAVSAGGYLGGHLAYKQGAQANMSVAEMRRLSDGWRPVADLDQVPPGVLVTRTVDDVDVVAYREGDDVTVMLERCAHQSGPLGEGKVEQVDGHACVVCPWHGSTFRLRDGEVVHGPAGTDQQVLPSRVVNGVLEARLP